ncbi:fish-egg lectin-like [Eleutherodactylus coqui]|uniref:fish-egg lectin-like n=1 Tax=Eleutherodactylus coqui TaxID=57060 RepID=UPI0034629617
MMLLLCLLLLGTSVAADHELMCTVIPGNLKQVDAGAGKVYGVNDNGNIFRWVKGEWKQIPGALIHVTVGPAGVWGVNEMNTIHKLQDDEWVPVSGKMKQIDAGGAKFLAGTDGDNWVYCLNQDQTVSKSTDPSFTKIEGSLNYYSSGPMGCWGTDTNNKVMFRFDVQPMTCQGSFWKTIEGSLVMVEVGTDGSVYGVDPEGKVYKREGISCTNHVGTSWTQLDLPGTFKHVSYDRGWLWLVRQNGEVLKCNVKHHSSPDGKHGPHDKKKKQ